MKNNFTFFFLIHKKVQLHIRLNKMLILPLTPVPRQRTERLNQLRRLRRAFALILAGNTDTASLLRNVVS